VIRFSNSTFTLSTALSVNSFLSFLLAASTSLIYSCISYSSADFYFSNSCLLPASLSAYDFFNRSISSFHLLISTFSYWSVWLVRGV
jgi:hypothetical protein